MKNNCVVIFVVFLITLSASIGISYVINSSIIDECMSLKEKNQIQADSIVVLNQKLDSKTQSQDTTTLGFRGKPPSDPYVIIK